MTDEQERVWLACVRWRGRAGYLELGTDRVWRAIGANEPGLSSALRVAQELASDYEYHPADGIPGRRLAEIVARAVKGQVEYPPAPPSEPGTIY